MEVSIVPQEVIEHKIYLLRGKKVMLDRDLALLYQVTTGALNQAVRRNRKRFPDDFMFQLTRQEFENLKSHFVTSSWGGVRKLPNAFTEQGVAMLSSVLGSERAIQVNIQIIRTFTKLREMMASNRELRRKIEELEQKYDKQFKVVFQTLKLLLEEEEQPKRRLGFSEKNEQNQTP